MDKVCSTYATGRQHMEAVTRMRQKVKDLLEYVHSYIYGPMQTATPSGEHYFVTFIDEASGQGALPSHYFVAKKKSSTTLWSTSDAPRKIPINKSDISDQIGEGNI